MTIGEALKHQRIRLGLTQDEMIQGIIHKSHYSKIERGIEGISAESLFKILFAHHVRKYWLNISTLFYLNTFSYLIFVY